MLLALLGAALCLLLTASANVANVELAGALGRARMYAIQAALGASRGLLLRITLLEGALLVAAAAGAGLALTIPTLDFIASEMSARLIEGTVNPIDVDIRAGAFMLAIAAGTWIIVSVPVLLASIGIRLVQAMQADSRTAAASSISTTVRRGLTAAQISLAVVLMVGGLLFARTYDGLLAVDRGVDTTNVASIAFTLPPHIAPAEVDDIAAAVIARLRHHDDVVSATRLLGPAPPAIGFAMQARPEIDGRETGNDAVALIYNVEQAFFETLRMPLLIGRIFRPDDPPAHAVISESMARRFWPGANPVGHTFRISPSYPRYTVMGVVPHVRNNRDGLAGPTDSTFTFYLPPPAKTPDNSRLQRGAPAGPPPVNVPAASRGRVMTFLARLTDASRLDAVQQAAHGGDRRVQVRAELLDEQYARRHDDILLATSIVTAFGMLSTAVTSAGVYGVMAFLVACRTREIAVRMALGASGRDVRALVFGSALRWVAAGVALGLCGAALASRWIESHLFGVAPLDPVTYATVALVVVVTAVLATWLPARRAARLDPVLTLRAE